MMSEKPCNQSRLARLLPCEDECPTCGQGECHYLRYEKPEQAETGEKPYMWLGKEAETA